MGVPTRIGTRSVETQDIALTQGSVVVGNASGSGATTALARGSIVRGDASGYAAAYSAKAAGKILAGDGTDVSAQFPYAVRAAEEAAGRTYVYFVNEPYTAQLAKTTYAIATAADNQEDFFITRDGYYFEWIQTGQNDIKFMVPAATGWTLPCDKANADGIEITQGIISGCAWNKQFTIGTSAAFMVRATLKIADRQDDDVVQVGFRRLGAYADVTDPASVITAYSDVAYIGINAAAGQFYTNTRLNTGVGVATALAHAAHTNTEYVDLTVNVTLGGVVTYLIGTGATVALAKAAAAADASAVAFTFDATDIVIPSILLVATGTAAAPAVVLAEYECGFQG